MRLIIAALFVVACLFAVVAIVSMSGIGERAPIVVGLTLGLLLILLSIAAVYLFNPWWANPLGLMKPEELLRRLEEKGLLVSSDFQARRAFGVREFDDEGLHYFLELADGRVLFLSGQYLYDYEPIEDDLGGRSRGASPASTSRSADTRPKGTLLRSSAAELSSNPSSSPGRFLGRRGGRSASWKMAS